MKKLVLLTLAAATLAGNAKAQAGFGPEIGLNLYNIKQTQQGQTINGNYRPGFKIGIVGDNQLSPKSGFYLQPGFFISVKGANLPYDDTKVSINYAEVPVNLLYKFATGSGDHFFVGAGPYFAGAVSGNISNSLTSHNLEIGPDATSDNIAFFDFGIGAQAGYQLNTGFFVRGQFQQGLANISPANNTSPVNPGNTAHNSGFSITVGWLFGEQVKVKTKKPAPAKG